MSHESNETQIPVVRVKNCFTVAVDCNATGKDARNAAKAGAETIVGEVDEIDEPSSSGAASSSAASIPRVIVAEDPPLTAEAGRERDRVVPSFVAEDPPLAMGGGAGAADPPLEMGGEAPLLDLGSIACVLGPILSIELLKNIFRFKCICERDES